MDNLREFTHNIHDAAKQMQNEIQLIAEGPSTDVMLPDASYPKIGDRVIYKLSLLQQLEIVVNNGVYITEMPCIVAGVQNTVDLKNKGLITLYEICDRVRGSMLVNRTTIERVDAFDYNRLTSTLDEQEIPSSLFAELRSDLEALESLREEILEAVANGYSKDNV